VAWHNLPVLEIIIATVIGGIIVAAIIWLASVFVKPHIAAWLERRRAKRAGPKNNAETQPSPPTSPSDPDLVKVRIKSHRTYRANANGQRDVCGDIIYVTKREADYGMSRKYFEPAE